ncbi:MAG: phosphatase subfamily [Patescibacteria group bacterium]|jgi:HAD superfamily phosphatase (TIGR01668 family)|nr:phosphatase subfamily [Patescibacteria group bacterium]
MKRILAPCFRAKDVTDVTPAFLRKNKIKAAILDLDGSLVGYQGPEASPEVTSWIANMLIEDIKVCIVSNPGPGSTLEQIARQLNLKAFRGVVPKPLPKAFLKARRYLKTEFSEIAIIGDQLFTDMLGGNLVGMTTIWTCHIKGAPEGWITKNINRRLERLYLDRVLVKDPSISPYISSQ